MFGFQPLAKVPIADDVIDSVPVSLTATGVSGTGQVGSVVISGANDTPAVGLEASVGPHATVTFTVTVANSGSGNKFYIDGAEAPTLNLVRNTTYVFDVSDNSVSGHPLAFKDGGGNSYTTGVTTTGTAGNSGAKVTFVVPSNAPDALRYYCTVHGNGMGNTIAVSTLDFSVSGDASVGVTGIAATGGSSGVVAETGIGVSVTGVEGGTPNPFTSVGFTDVTIIAISNITVAVSGVAASGNVGATGAAIPKSVDVGGSQATVSTNGVTVGGAADVAETGFQASSAVGSPTIIGAASVAVSGLSGTGAVGSANIAIPVTVSVTGVTSSTAVRGVEIVIPVNVSVTGPSSTGTAGSATTIGTADIPSTGLAASTFVGSVTSTATANISVTGISATTATSSVTPYISFPTTADGSTGLVGSVTITGRSGVAVTGVSTGTPLVGQVRMYNSVDPLQETLADPYSPLVIDVPTENVYNDINLTVDESAPPVWSDLDIENEAA